MNTKSVLLVLLSGMALFSSAAGERKSTAPGAGRLESFIRDGEIKLHQRLFGSDEKRSCDRLLAGAKGTARLRLLVLSSQYCRFMEKDPTTALETMAETVLPRSECEAWKKGLQQAKQTAQAEWLAACRKSQLERAALPPEPAGLALAFPPIGQWAMGSSNIECVIEIAHAHMDLKLWRESLKIADMLGRNYEGINRVLAGECAGDAMGGMSRFDQAVELYRFSLSGFSTLCSYDGKLPAEYEPIKRRIEESLRRTLRQLEIEKFGLGYVLYRDARWTQHRDGAAAEALLMYDDLAAHFDKTVYAEAGKAYAAECLLALAEPQAAKATQESIRKAGDAVQTRQVQLAAMKRARVPKKAMEEEQKLAALDLQRLDRLKAMPSGKDAATLAAARVTAFVKENQYGLYRGEALVNCASHAFHRQLDSAAAERLFGQAWAWLESVEAVDAQLDAFDVPEKARGHDWIFGIWGGEFFGGSDYGGWGFTDNIVYYDSGSGPGEFSTLWDADKANAEYGQGHMNIKAVPFFDSRRPVPSLLRAPDDPNGPGSQYARAHRAELLAQAIPALSFATGSNPVQEITDQGGLNFNMNALYQNGWPAERLNHPTREDRWLHGDYRAVAYVYVFRMFDAIKDIGGFGQ